MRNVAIYFLAGLFLGSLFTWIGTSSQTSLSPTVDERVFKFVENDVRAYGAATSVEDKVLQGDLLYKKAVKLFVADMGLLVTGLDPEAPSVMPKVDEDAAPTMDEGDPGTPGSKPTIPNQLKAPKNEVSEAVRKLPYAKKTDIRLQKLNGKFEGLVTRFAGNRKGETDRLVLEIDMKVVRGLLTGLYHIELTGPKGEVISRKHHVGPNKSIRLASDSKLKLWLDVGTTRLIQLNVGNGNNPKGHFYNPEGQKVGKVSLKRI